MRTGWVPASASALVVGVMALTLATVLNPSTDGEGATATLHVVNEAGARWLGMAVMFFGASVALTAGLPALLTLFRTRARMIGTTGVVVFSVGVVGLCGISMLLVFFRALVVQDAVRAGALQAVTDDTGLAVFVYVWIGGFYLGLALIAIALLIAKRTPLWVPVVLIVYVLTLPLGSQLGRIGSAVQVLILAVAFTGIAVAAVGSDRTTATDTVF
jgi:hypothetical protein